MPKFYWRLDYEMVSNPKIQQLSPPSFRFWVMLCTYACEHGGYLPADPEIAKGLGLTIVQYRRYLHELKKAGVHTLPVEIRRVIDGHQREMMQ